MQSKVLRASELVTKLRRIEERHRTGQPNAVVFNIHETAKESADMIETLLSMIFDIAEIVYSKEEKQCQSRTL